MTNCEQNIASNLSGPPLRPDSCPNTSASPCACGPKLARWKGTSAGTRYFIRPVAQVSATIAAVRLRRPALAQVDRNVETGRIAFLDPFVEEAGELLHGLLAGHDHLLREGRVLGRDLDQHVAALEQEIGVARIDDAMGNGPEVEFQGDGLRMARRD